MTVAHAERCSNGNVMVFDQEGAQMTELQGRFEQVKDKILENSDDQTEFYVTDWQLRTRRRVSRQEWES